MSDWICACTNHASSEDGAVEVEAEEAAGASTEDAAARAAIEEDAAITMKRDGCKRNALYDRAQKKRGGWWVVRAECWVVGGGR